ncbi:MAG: hypothetical protein OT477_08645 [Chloroflexi bacterium]|nr:hypothetical protein [Chloroflexota bacterium]
MRGREVVERPSYVPNKPLPLLPIPATYLGVVSVWMGGDRDG